MLECRMGKINCLMGFHSWSSDCEVCATCGKHRWGAHEWRGCKCSVCGKNRDRDHDWSSDCEKCVTCGQGRSNAHSWSGCKCSACGRTRSVGHSWKGCKCLVCGQTQDKDHDWRGGCDHQKCSNCGHTRSNSHSWTGCKCTVCAKTQDKDHDWSRDCERCIQCGHARPGTHDWSRQQGSDRCTRCGELCIDLGSGIALKLVPIHSGTFIMGGEDTQRANEPQERPQHQVTISRDFYIGKYLVTQEQYERLIGINPSHVKGKRNPVETVSRKDSMEFCRKLSEICGKKCRLPTEAEWEYACRAGTTTKYSFGNETFEQRKPGDDRPLISGGFYGNIVEVMSDYAWYDRNLGRTANYDPLDDSKTIPVGQKKPNPWGLYDMHGNVWEWCLDWYGIYPSTPVTDPVGPSDGAVLISRGGAWCSSAKECRSASRGYNSFDSGGESGGFRVLMECS